MITAKDNIVTINLGDNNTLCVLLTPSGWYYALKLQLGNLTLDVISCHRVSVWILNNYVSLTMEKKKSFFNIYNFVKIKKWLFTMLPHYQHWSSHNMCFCVQSAEALMFSVCLFFGFFTCESIFNVCEV